MPTPTTLFIHPFIVSSLCVMGLVLLSGGAVAQTGTRSVTPKTQPTAPSSSAGVTSGQVNPSGLASPVPRPAGLTGQFPAGLPSPSPFPAGVPPLGGPTATSTVTPAPALDTGGVAPAPVAMGVAAAGAGRTVGAGRPYTPIELARSFLLADTNRDGELSRAEAQGLLIMPMGFDEMDSNHDGVISRFEYEDATR